MESALISASLIAVLKRVDCKNIKENKIIVVNSKYLKAVLILNTVCIDDLFVFFENLGHTKVPLEHAVIKSHVCW